TTDMPTVRQTNPHARAGEIAPELDNANLVIHNPSVERFPWSGTVLAVHVVRFLSVLLGTWAVFLTWALIHELYPEAPWIPLASAAVHAFTPMYLFISSSVNNDNLIIPLCSWALLLMLRRVRAASAPLASYRSSIGLGCVVGLAMLTKTSGIVLLPFVAATIAWETWRMPGPASWRHRITFALQHAALVAVPIVAISGWWYARNLRLYGDSLGWNAFGAVLGTRDVPAGLGQLWAERMAFAAGYWGNFGGLNVPLPGWAFALLNTLAVIAAAGLVLRLGQWLAGSGRTGAGITSADQPHSPLVSRIWPLAWTPMTAAHALAWAWPAAIFISWIRWAAVTWSSQGRLIFPAIPLWSLALVLGLNAWVPRNRTTIRVFPGAALGLLLFALTLVALPVWILPAYRAPKTTAADSVPAGYDAVNARFGDVLELVGYRLVTKQTSPDGILELELVWRSLGATTSYHSLFIHALGQGDRIIAQRDTFPGHGLLPTTQLEPGRTWRERHVLQIPHTAYTPDALTLSVGVYETATGVRVTPSQPGTDDGEDSIRFGQVALVSAGDVANKVELRFGEGIVLQSYDISDLVLTPGTQVEITLNWLCTAPIEHDYTVSVQLIDDQWNKAGQSDAWPLDGQRPTTSWQPGELITESRVLTIAPNTPPGAYKLRLALYRPTPEGELEHLPVSQSREGMPSKAIELTTLRVQD
ncbi:MAG: glycosyltransferase family 39 protein, partial [Anaerolineae bacterium]|nr:glycosyltransferase family 39 protein [Anaerolineae bacterium]